jgi:hypothetical protein
MRWSSKQQDTAETTVAMAVQLRPQRSLPKALTVRRVLPSVVRSLIEQEHYVHCMPSAPCCCFGVYLDAELVGAVVFTSGARQVYRLLDAARPQDVVTLARLWLSDTLPANSESRVLGIVLRLLRQSTSWKLVLSYADPAVGHVGTIYQATGWHYLGQSEPGTYIKLGEDDDQLYHPRSIYRRFGSNAIGHLHATGIPAIRQSVSGKYRYAYVLDPTWYWRIQRHIQPYPRAPERGPPA